MRGGSNKWFLLALKLIIYTKRIFNTLLYKETTFTGEKIASEVDFFLSVTFFFCPHFFWSVHVKEVQPPTLKLFLKPFCQLNFRSISTLTHAHTYMYRLSCKKTTFTDTRDQNLDDMWTIFSPFFFFLLLLQGRTPRILTKENV